MRRALENLVALCIEEGVSFLIIAGDLFDGDWRDFSTGLFFVRQMARLREAGVRVFIARGNHDAQSQITRALRLPDNVREFSWNAAESFEVHELGVVLHGRSFARRAEFNDLAASFPPARRELVNIGVLHTSLTGHELHEPYAPCSVEELVAHGYDYWALGHIHERRIVRERPYIVYPGNLQGRHMREIGAKGCTLVTVENRRIASVEHRELDNVRFVRVEVDITLARNIDQVAERAQTELARVAFDAGDRILAVRVELCGPSPTHLMLASQPEKIIAEVRAAAIQAGGDEIWIERVVVSTTKKDDAKDHPSGALAEIQDLLTEIAVRGAASDLVPEEVEKLVKRLPDDVRKSAGMNDLEAADGNHALLHEAIELARGRLIQREEEA